MWRRNLTSEGRKTLKEWGRLKIWKRRFRKWNSLVIYGVPEDKWENELHLMRQLASALQFPDWSYSLVDAVHRMGKTSGSQPRSLMINFFSHLDNDAFWNKQEVLRNLKATDHGLCNENLLYLSLTPVNRELLKGAHEVAKAKGNSQVWMASCSVFVYDVIKGLRPSRLGQLTTGIACNNFNCTYWSHPYFNSAYFVYNV